MERFDTLQSSGHSADAQHDSDPSLLVFILDTNPSAWAALNGPSLRQSLADVLIFINAHLAFNHRNQTAIIASHIETACFLYPSKTANSRKEQARGTQDAQRAANAYRTFLAVQDEAIENLQALLDSTTEASISSNHSSMMSGAITLALSYINRQSQLHNDEANLRSRIMILSVSGDLAFQYIPMMNCIFSAQKQKVVIDIAKIGGDAVFLQQASDATAGLYQNIKPGQSLLQTMMMLFLPDQATRAYLNLPVAANVDFRAACFCHKRVLDVGFVCSVCLSIFCQALPKCITCDAVFDIQELKAFGAKPAVLLRKKKKAISQREDSIVIE